MPFRGCQGENNKREITVNIVKVSHYESHLDQTMKKQVRFIVWKIRYSVSVLLISFISTFLISLFVLLVCRRCFEFLDLLLQEWQTGSLER